MKISKKIIFSLFGIVAFSGIAIGSTYALFTSKAESNVVVSSGKVNVTADFGGQTLYSGLAKDYYNPSTDVVEKDGDIIISSLAEDGHYYYNKEVSGTFSNGGTAVLTEGVLSLTNITSGDKIKSSLTITNNSNVSIKYRVVAECISTENADLYLYSKLAFKFGDKEMTGLKKTHTLWTVSEPSVAIPSIPISVQLPITAGNDCQNLHTTIRFTVEAVQANAYTVDGNDGILEFETQSAADPLNPAQLRDLEYEAGDNGSGDPMVVVEVPATNGNTKAGDSSLIPADDLTLKVESVDRPSSIVIASDEDTVDYELLLVNQDNKKVTSTATEIVVKMYVGDKNIQKVLHNGVEVPFEYEDGYVIITTNSFSPYSVIYKNEPMPVAVTLGILKFYKLADFRDYVNGSGKYDGEPHNCAGETAVLASDIDLSGVSNWVPIGTALHPFSGIFDGQNHIISGLTVSAVEKGGLFGVISGTANSLFKTNEDIWDFVNNIFDGTKLAASNYGAGIKNLEITDFEVTGSTSGKKHLGVVAGIADGAHISNITVSDGTVTGYKVVGGIVASAYNCTIDSCVTEDDVTVEALNYHSGGIVGAVNTATADFRLAIINCVNNAHIIAHGNGSGYEGGIIGDANSDKSKAKFFYNCVNNGVITASGDHVTGIVGNMGVNAGEVSPIISACTNNGAITSLSGDTLKNVSGIVSNAAGLVHNCTNYGKISGAVTVAAAGIVASTYQTAVTIYNSTNFGDLSQITGVTPKEAVSDVQGTLILQGQTYANVAALQAAISSAGASIILKNLTIVDKSGTLVLPSNVNNITADSSYFEGLDISNCSSSYITITIPNFVYTLHGDALTKTIGLSGSNNKTIFASDCKLDWLRNYGSNGTYVKQVGCVVNLVHGAVEVFE